MAQPILSAFEAALAELAPERLVASWMARHPVRFGRVVAWGKAARPMLEGARRYWDGPALAISPYAWGHPPGATRHLRSDHPLLSRRSLEAGQAVLDFVSHGEGELLFLLSGGASALAESLRPEVEPESWVREWERLYRAGLSIVEMNRARSRVSRLKRGGLLEFCNAPGRSLILSDVLQGPRWVGSGPTWRGSGEGCELLADGHGLASALQRRLAAQGWDCRIAPPLLDGVDEALEEIAGWRLEPGQAVLAPAEVRLPVTGSGCGGRCQELVLRGLDWLASRPDCVLLALASDGQDGSSPAGGAWADAATRERARQRGLDPGVSLAEQDSDRFFRALGQLWEPGPTHNNLNDVVVLARFGKLSQ